jgi:redox-sensitive bicupin YhaK (pirin superfamily)
MSTLDIYFEKGFKIGIEMAMEKGRQEMIEQKNHQFVKTLLLDGRCTSAEIADFVSVSEEYVEKVKSSL